jgi:GNAT superfamily N-acetyltransferase
MNSPVKISVKPVDKSTWKDFEHLFESKGAPSYCWCMAWRAQGVESKKTDRPSRKKMMKKRISDNVPVGLLAYHHDMPIAWCSIAPRETYRKLDGDDTISDVWSIVCFYIKKEFRKQGLTESLIKEARKFAKKNGAKYLEAYPVDPSSPSYRFMGFKNTFKNLGFNFIKKAGQRRNVMTKKI